MALAVEQAQGHADESQQLIVFVGFTPGIQRAIAPEWPIDVPHRDSVDVERGAREDSTDGKSFSEKRQAPIGEAASARDTPVRN